MIFFAKTDSNKSLFHVVCGRAQKKVLANGIKLYHKYYINLFSHLTYVKTMKRLLMSCKCIRPEGANEIEKKKVCKISQFLESFSCNSKNAFMFDLNDYSLFSEKYIGHIFLTCD